MARPLILLLSLFAAYPMFAQQNILLIIADDLGLDPMPNYLTGPQKASMPNLSSLMSEGLTFDNAWATPLCSPTRAALITGRQGHETNVLGVSTLNQLAQSETTLFEYLEDINSGYASALIGKWHLGGTTPAANDPGMQGVPHFTGILDGGVQNYFNWPQTTNGVLGPNQNYVTEVLTDSAIAWINGQTQPWFCWLAYNAPHAPFHRPPLYMHSQGALPTDQASIDADPLPYYLAMVESVDHEIGRLLDAIPADQLSNTTIVFIGDNGTPGEVVQAPYLPSKAKGTLYQGGVQVPLVITGAGVSRAGQREDALVGVTDLFSTIVELTGQALPEYASSKSLLPLLTQSGLEHRACVRTDGYGPLGIGHAVRDEQYKLIDFGNGTQEFYIMGSDPYESNDLFDMMTCLIPPIQEAYAVLAEGCTTAVGTGESMLAPGFRAYPNPSSGMLRIDGVGGPTEAILMDALGRAVMHVVLRSGTDWMDLSHLKDGTYMLRGEGIAMPIVLQR